jgi:putative phosphonate metabolism protein
MVEARYAVYYAPPDDCAFAHAGNRWLGRDAASGEFLEQPKCPGLTPTRLARLTTAARRYGFHGTLKPPFALRNGRSLAELEHAVAALAARQRTFTFQVRLAPLSDFLAWLPTSGVDTIDAVASTCVRELDDFRAPPSEAELRRRLAAGLSRNQEALLRRWGYPYVLEEFRFHLTLTDATIGPEAQSLLAALEAGCAGHGREAIRFDSLCLFAEPGPGADFHLLARYGFDGSIKHYAGAHE